jgi:hypothetical protein
MSKNQLTLGFDKHHFWYNYNSTAWFLALRKFGYIPFFCVEGILPKKDQGIITLIKHKACINYPQ